MFANNKGNVMKNLDGFGYIVVDLLSGAMDGFYSEKTWADDVLLRFSERYPMGWWVVAEIKDNPQEKPISDYLFHCDRLQDQEKTYGEILDWYNEKFPHRFNF